MTSDVSNLRRGSLALVAISVGEFVADYGFKLGLSRLLPPHAFGDVRVAREFAVLAGVAVLLSGDRASRERLATSLPMMGVFIVAPGLNQSDFYFLEILGD